MKQHLLYVIAPQRLSEFEIAMKRLKAEPSESPKGGEKSFKITHRLLEKLELNVCIVTEIDSITAFLRQNPVDLLIYDERGPGTLGVVKAVQQIKKDVKQLEELWGPDLNFPSSRIVAILKEGHSSEHTVFDLGRLNVRDIIVAPKSTALMLRWLKNILYHGIIRENKTGIALSGGAIEGLLYQIGVLHGLNMALSNRKLDSVDVVSGVSSGSIAGSIIAAKIPILDVLRAIHGLPSKSPHLKLSTLFDFAGLHIFRRFTRVSLSMPKSQPSQWIPNLSQSIPTGFFMGDRFESYLRSVFETHGKTTNLSELDTKFYVGVTDQDNFKHVVLGKAPFENIDIPSAVRASSALPPLFTPKRIAGRNYIDGQVTKSCNLESVVEEGARLIFIIDPLKPFKSTTAGIAEKRGGLYSILQMVKALVATRFEAALSAVSQQYPDVDFLVFQPDEECAKLMSGSPLRSKFRTEIIESAYQGTLRTLRERHHIYATKMERYGFKLKSPEELRELESNYHGILESTSESKTD
ncbi:MAG: patatin-like phospholipase family protein [Pseudobacteriovorax sp.]|nr:patatin-like phospholipase family protein [Pseudobacteriovorax sp.]